MDRKLVSTEGQKVKKVLKPNHMDSWPNSKIELILEDNFPHH